MSNVHVFSSKMRSLTRGRKPCRKLLLKVGSMLCSALIDDVNQFYPDGAINCGEGNPFTIGQLHHEREVGRSGSVRVVW